MAVEGACVCMCVFVRQGEERRAKPSLAHAAPRLAAAAGQRRRAPHLPQAPVHAHFQRLLEVPRRGGDDALAAHPHRDVVKQGLGGGKTTALEAHGGCWRSGAGAEHAGQ